jgi:hypothetical protein
MSVLIFGLGAAALLRAAHEEFANLPARRTAPAPMFARQTDDQPPTLAMLRIDTSADEKPAQNVAAAPAPEVAADAPAQPAQSVSPIEPEKLAAVRPAEPMQAEAAKPETAAFEPPAPPVTAEAAAPEVKLAAVAEAPQGADASVPPAPDIYSFESNPAATRIATLGGPAVIVDEKAAADASGKAEAKATEGKPAEAKTADAKTAEAKPDRNAAKKRAAEQAREKRRIAAARRARQAREAALTLQQQQPNPFIQTPFAQGPVAR